MKTLILLSLLVSLPTFAAEWKINKDHSEVLFKVPYLNVSEITGRFTDYSGTLDFDEKSREITKVNIEISSSTIDTGHKMRDNHLKASDFLESKEYPNIVFKAEKATKLKKDEYRVDGTLTIKKVSRPFTINFSLTDSVKDTWGYENKFVKYSSKLSRKDFGITWNKTLDADKFLVGDEITFWGVFQIQPSSSLTPSSKHMIPDTEYIREREVKLRSNEGESSFSQKIRKLINGQ